MREALSGLTVRGRAFLAAGVTAVVCAVLLGRAYRASRVRLLFWSTVCFAALTLTNVLLFVDLTVIPGVDLQPLRSGMTLLGVSALLYGLTFSES